MNTDTEKPKPHPIGFETLLLQAGHGDTLRHSVTANIARLIRATRPGGELLLWVRSGCLLQEISLTELANYHGKTINGIRHIILTGSDAAVLESIREIAAPASKEYSHVA